MFGLLTSRQQTKPKQFQKQVAGRKGFILADTLDLVMGKPGFLSEGFPPAAIIIY